MQNIIPNRSLIVKTLLTIFLLVSLAGCAGTLHTRNRNLAVNTALHEIGVKYRFGGVSPITGFDCSGLIYYAYKQFGYKVPRTTGAMYKASSRVFLFRHPGDLLFFNTEYKWWNIFSWFRVTHVGIYLGNGRMLHAPETGGYVHIVNNIFKNKYWVNAYKDTRRLSFRN